MPSRNYTIHTRIECGIETVFQAIVDESQLVRYFADRSSGPLQAGTRVTWFWQDHGDYPVQVLEVEPPRRIRLELDSGQWGKDSQSYPVQVLFELESLDENATRLTISESGWPTSDPGLRASHENCSGWTHMAMCLKAFLEHQICLR